MGFVASSTPSTALLLNPCSWLLWALDSVLWCLLPIPLLGPLEMCMKFAKGNYSTAEKVGQRVNVTCEQGPISLPKGEYSECTTVHELMQFSFAKFASKNLFGTRKYLGEYKPEGARFPLKKFGDSSWMTYREVQARAASFGAGLCALGCVPQPVNKDYEEMTGPHTILLWEDTCAEWLTALIGAGGQSIAVATSYATLGIEAVSEALNNSQCPIVVCNFTKIAECAALKSKCPSLTTVIYTTNLVTDADVAKGPPACPGLRVISFDEVCTLSTKDYTPPEPSTMSVIMYTSGSTGKPKGVKIKHESFIASCAGFLEWIMQTGSLKLGEETYLAYLPAAHILELVAEHAMVGGGAAIGFASPQTISSKGACRERPDGTINLKPEWPYPPGAIQEFKPTVLAGVPKIWDIFKKGVEDKLGKGSPVARYLFEVAFTGRALALSQGRDSPLFKLLFKKVAQVAGGRLKLGITGGGPCASDVQTFVRTAFAMPFIQGYALTETCCAGAVQLPDDARDGVVGPPLASVRVRLNDCTEVLDSTGKPYLTTDTFHGPNGTACAGRGEIWISGTSVSAGYFKMPEKTAEEFITYEGKRWFKTGDIGLFTTDGCIRIVDRLKNLIKLKGGEYIAIENMEAVYGGAGVVNALNGGVMCYGTGDMDKPVALVQVEMGAVKKWAAEQNISYATPEALCELPATEKYVLDELNKIGKAGKLGANEILAAVKLHAGTGEPTRGADVPPQFHDPWTPQNGALTATNKINRKPIEQFFKSEMKVLAAKGIRP